MKAIIITAQDVQDEEYLYPYYRLLEAGFELDVWVIPHKGNKNPTGKYGIPIRPAPGKSLLYEFSEVGYNLDLVVIPGGWAPEIVRMSKAVVAVVESEYNRGTVISAICHGPQVLISARIVKGKTITGFEGIRDDIESAGATYAGAGVFVDGNIVTADHYRENPEWMKQTLKLVEQKVLATNVVH